MYANGVFVDLSKAFGSVWHNDLSYKLKKNSGICGNAVDLIESFLYNRHQRAALNDQSSN